MGLGEIYSHRIEPKDLAQFLPPHDFERQRVEQCYNRLKEIRLLKKNRSEDFDTTALDLEVYSIKQYLNRRYGVVK